MWFKPCGEIEGDHIDHLWAVIDNYVDKQGIVEYVTVYVCSGDKGSRNLQAL